jgi:hypothetical protein
MNSKGVNYTPTVGSCAPYRFSTTKQQCTDIQNEMNCIKQQSFSVNGCAMCFQDDTFHFIEPSAVYTGPSFIVTGTGTLIYSNLGSKPQTLTLSSTPQTIDASALNEGDVVQFNVTPESGSLCGYLIGQTNGGDFRIDLIRIVQSDTITGANPRLSGTQLVDGQNYTVMRPGRGKSVMNLTILNTFTFLDPSEPAAMKCGSAPYIKKENNLKFLNNSPCYKNGQKPGSYSLDCLQQTFQNAGCTPQGTGYPSNTAKAQELMTDKKGSFLKIGDIASLVYANSLLAYTGKNPDGSSLPLEVWNNYNLFCTGKTITSPCDASVQSGDPPSTDCLSYLWQNAGASGKIGSSYTASTDLSSLDPLNNNRFCTPNGSMAPIDPSGNQNINAIDTARSQGDIKAIQTFYDNIHKRANDNRNGDMGRKNAVKQCYGIDLIVRKQ